jgi:mycofactocin system FadH/OYE family oxidoreductase 2
MAYPHVFSPLQIGPVTVKNRILSSAHLTHLAENGLWTDGHLEYYRAKARGGVGLIVTGAQSVQRWDRPILPLGNMDNPFVAGQPQQYRRVIDAVHGYGTRIFAQLAHGGRQNWDAYAAMEPLIAPSPIPCPVVGHVPKELEAEDIDLLIEEFADAARILAESGFDGVEIHSAYGYLLTEFLTPTTNHRTDEYGGSLENRMRLPIEILQAVRSVVGSDIVVGVRMPGDEYVDGGLTIEDTTIIARGFEATGLIDYLSISAGTYTNMLAMDVPMYVPLGYNRHLAAAIKDEVDLPVMVAGRIKDPEMAEATIAEGQADMVAMTRATIADPDLPRKMLDGHEDQIRNCIACNQRCLGNLALGLPVGCMVNPVAGREYDPFWADLSPAIPPRRVLIVGGGPAGCEAARVLAERGHDVTIIDAGDELGGQLLTVQKASGREEWQDVNRYYDRELSRLRVDIRLGTAADAHLVRSSGAQTVIIATGSHARTNPLDHLPPLDGIAAAVNVRDVLESRVDVGQRVIVYAGDNHIQGLTTADTLLDRGKDVTVAIPQEAPGKLAEAQTTWALMTRLGVKGAQAIELLTAVTAFAGGEATLVDLLTGRETAVGCDTLVSSFGGSADDRLYLELKGTVADLRRIGDCVAPRTADTAIYDGAKMGRLV